MIFSFFFVSTLFVSSDLYYFLPSLSLGFICSSFSNSLRWQVKLFVIILVSWSRLVSINFPLQTAFAECHSLKNCVFMFIRLKVFSDFLFDFFTHSLFFISVFFSLHVFVFFPFPSRDFQFYAIVVRNGAWLNFKLVEIYFCDLECDISWRKFLVHLKRMCIMLVLDGMSQR